MTKYDEIMEQIHVDEAMEERILSALDQAETGSAKSVSKKNNKTLLKVLSAAACLMLVAVGAPLLTHIGNELPTVSEPITETIPDFVDCASIKELSDILGYDITEPSLPFETDPRETIYTACWHTYAQIDYTAVSGETACYRQGIGDEDISGDYNNYSDVRTLKNGEINLTLKGENGAYSLAVWTDGKSTYSLSLSSPIGEEAWLTLIDS